MQAMSLRKVETFRHSTVHDSHQGDTDVFLLRPFATTAALSSTDNEQSVKSRLVNAVPSINAFAVA
jgi:hypothetical protein